MCSRRFDWILVTDAPDFINRELCEIKCTWWNIPAVLWSFHAAFCVLGERMQLLQKTWEAGDLFIMSDVNYVLSSVFTTWDRSVLSPSQHEETLFYRVIYWWSTGPPPAQQEVLGGSCPSCCQHWVRPWRDAAGCLQSQRLSSINLKLTSTHHWKHYSEVFTIINENIVSKIQNMFLSF